VPHFRPMPTSPALLTAFSSRPAPRFARGRLAAGSGIRRMSPRIRNGSDDLARRANHHSHLRWSPEAFRVHLSPCPGSDSGCGRIGRLGCSFVEQTESAVLSLMRAFSCRRSHRRAEMHARLTAGWQKPPMFPGCRPPEAHALTAVPGRLQWGGVSRRLSWRIGSPCLDSRCSSSTC